MNAGKPAMDALTDQAMAVTRDLYDSTGPDAYAETFAAGLAAQFPGQEATVSKVLCAAAAVASGIGWRSAEAGLTAEDTVRDIVRKLSFAAESLNRRAR